MGRTLRRMLRRMSMPMNESWSEITSAQMEFWRHISTAQTDLLQHIKSAQMDLRRHLARITWDQIELKLVDELRTWLNRRYSLHRNRQFDNNAAVPDTLTDFAYKLLAQATDGFGKAIGRGGFGSVYKGILPDGMPVAVKRLPRDGDDESFHAEVAAMATLNHTNLVRLVGVCTKSIDRFLVYEFMENSSLDRWIFSADPEQRRQLDWKTRRSIALGVAKGLAYLHDDSRNCVLHMDIKPENILLDDAFRPKIADFGLAKTLKRDLESRLVTYRMRGTPGYMAPEWLYNINGGITAKSDVFSFGVMLLEMVCGRRCVESSRSEGSWFLPTVAFCKAREGCVEQLLDPAVEAPRKEEMVEIVRLIRIALWCVQGNPAMRPAMSAVVSMIPGDLPVNEPPPDSNIPFAPSGGSFQSNVSFALL